MFKKRRIGPAAVGSLDVLLVGAVLAGVDSAQAQSVAAAAATSADANVSDEVVVYGFRESLDRALDLKRSDTGASDSILAEDIADFPDLNLAESLQRLPGVSIARDAGEGRQITIRGLGPNFTRVRINGMEGLTTAGGTDSSGGTNRDRPFDFNIFASELFSNLTVRKTSAAEIDEGSLGATVDLQTPRPFDYNDTVLAASLQAGYNDLSSDASPRASMLFSTRSDSGVFGGLISVAYTERSLDEEGHSTVRWQNGNLTCPACDALPTAPERTAANAAVDTAFTPRLPRYGVLEHDLERIGITGALQFRPSDRTDITLDVLYADLDSTRTENFLEAPDWSAGGNTGRAGIDVLSYQLDSKNNLIAGTFDDVDVRSEGRYDELSTKFDQITLTLNQELGDALRLRALVGTSKSDHDNPVQTTLTFDRIDSDGYTYDYRNDDRLPLITYGFDVTSPSSYALTQVRMRPQTAENTFDNAEVDLAWELGDRLTLKGGISFKEYDFETTELRRSNGTTANQEGNVAAYTATPLAQYSRQISLADAWDLPSGSVTSWLIPDVRTATSLFNLNSLALGPEPSLGNNRSVNEENDGFYLQLDFSAMLGNMPLRGNVGARYVETTQTSTGYQQAGTTPVPVTVKRDYDDVLPSLNLVLDVTDEVLLRLGYSQVITRPGLGNLTPGGTISVSGNNRTVTSGNPYLDPFSADAIDFGVEWYFAEGSLLSLALFHKDIKTFPQSVSVTQPFTGNPLGIPDSAAIAACGTVAGCSPAADWVFTQPFNSDGGDLDGYELAYQQDFGNGFGLILNYTHVESEIDYIDPAAPGGIATRDLLGLSPDAYNATVYFEKDRFSVRASAAYRDAFLGTIPGRNGNDVEGTNETFNVDLAATVNINDRVSLTFEGLNLTDEVNDQFVDTTDRVFVFHHTGREFFVGARYSLK
jgi:iron complex outermembrane recepter protein